MIVIRVSKKYFRPNEVDNLVGNANKAKRLLSWKPKNDIRHLIKEMLSSDLEISRKLKLKLKLKKKILIAGQEGMVGSSLYNFLKKRNLIF